MELSVERSPFSHVVFEWKRGRSAPIFAVTRRYAGDARVESEVGLVTEAQYAAAWAALDDCVRSSGDAARAVTDDGVGEVAVHDAEGVTTFAWPLSDPEGRACYGIVRDAVLAVAPLDEFRNAFWVEGEYGTLQTRTNVPARVYVDGVSTGRVTPVSDLQVEPGRRAVRWVAVSTGETRDAEVRVGAGQVTTINIDF